MLKIILLLLISNLSLAIAPHKIEYKLFKSGLELGTETRVLTQNNNIWTYSAKAKTEGVAKWFIDYKINANSIFTVFDKVYSKEFYSKEIEDGKLKKKINLTFNYNQVSTPKKTWNTNKPAVDFLNMVIAISQDLKNNNLLEYYFADGQTVEKYSFKNNGYEQLLLMGEDIKTIKLTTQGLTLNIAPKYDYLPVLIEKKGWKYEIKSFTRL